MKKITILGSTGSIGTSAIDVIRAHRDEFQIVAMSAHGNHKLLMEQIEEFNPIYVSIGTEEGRRAIEERYPELTVYMGEEGLKKLGALDEADIVLTAVSGNVGIEATVEAVKKGKRIALANKETLVCAGELINKMVEEYGAEIIPVDSEHSALFQSLESGRREEVSKLIITASGGPFRGRTTKDLEKVKLEDALKHPNWAMGRKITIDSSTLVNKGLEVIEAHYLFGIDYEDIEVVVHPQSIVHSLVEFRDRSVIAQLGITDMKVPIQYAFTYPERGENNLTERLDLVKLSRLDFEAPDMEVFKGLKFAFEAGKIGMSMPLIYNTANEVAVDLFLQGKIQYLDIYRIIEEAMGKHTPVELKNIEQIKEIDRSLRDEIYRKY
ncbi:1-deoxy-D-xylulose 5-phosphate reductoisomerase [Propionigenium maris DSM 9537]|uniref:1-deoxy-D-xylulose 5-phosphate reductoisomerase n=1 Tax=Propionigenium maris DSM 9537 TaxID=1123000 RepID=A0A9W6GMC8_9FUSO|nr:1-deoxy-D-xylulose-5-phosphate reductoisomerase [Propionigenium maris]GLI56456.1 1-deoxy-D-xylulose 5-phosphate reductoisomerase [Propionigenium maris DSM 9537]